MVWSPCLIGIGTVRERSARDGPRASGLDWA